MDPDPRRQTIADARASGASADPPDDGDPFGAFGAEATPSVAEGSAGAQENEALSLFPPEPGGGFLLVTEEEPSSTGTGDSPDRTALTPAAAVLPAGGAPGPDRPPFRDPRRRYGALVFLVPAITALVWSSAGRESSPPQQAAGGQLVRQPSTPGTSASVPVQPSDDTGTPSGARTEIPTGNASATDRPAPAGGVPLAVTAGPTARPQARTSAEAPPPGRGVSAAAPVPRPSAGPEPVRSSDPARLPPALLPPRSPGEGDADLSTAAVAPGAEEVPSPPSLAPRSSSPLSPSPLAVDRAAIELLLQRYAEAFSSLDVAAAKAVWPAVNERNLVRAFDTVAEQRFELGSCAISVTPPEAVASCDGRVEYVPNVGSRRVRSEPRAWTFYLREDQNQWSIREVAAR